MTPTDLEELAQLQLLIRRQLEPLPEIAKYISTDSTASQVAREMERYQELARFAAGPVEELRRIGLVDEPGQWAAELQRLGTAMEAVGGRYVVPQMSEITALLADYRSSATTAQATRLIADQGRLFESALRELRTPWLDMANQLRSVGGFVELQSIGQSLRLLPAFDARLVDSLRIDLGDWSTQISFPDAIFTDPLIRSAFYEEHGFNPALTRFPSEAFSQSLGLAGLRGTPPPAIQDYDYEEDAEIAEEEAAFARTNAAHDRLQRFETHLRRFIDESMTRVFGPHWIKHQVPEEIRKSWSEKRQRALDSGEQDRPLIAFADFSDYVPIITRKDNWERVFAPTFQRPMFVQESFQRLYPIRICAMHARMITQDDEIYLLVEVKRILGAIGIKI